MELITANFIPSPCTFQGLFLLEHYKETKNRVLLCVPVLASRRHEDALCKELSRLTLHYHGRLFNEDTRGKERQLDYDQAMFSI